MAKRTCYYKTVEIPDIPNSTLHAALQKKLDEDGKLETRIRRINKPERGDDPIPHIHCINYFGYEGEYIVGEFFVCENVNEQAVIYLKKGVKSSDTAEASKILAENNENHRFIRGQYFDSN